MCPKNAQRTVAVPLTYYRRSIRSRSSNWRTGSTCRCPNGRRLRFASAAHVGPWPMPRVRQSADPRRLTAEEAALFDAFYVMRRGFDRTLDAQLQRDHGISISELEVLMALIRAPGRRLRVRDLVDLHRVGEEPHLAPGLPDGGARFRGPAGLRGGSARELRAPHRGRTPRRRAGPSRAHGDHPPHPVRRAHGGAAGRSSCRSRATSREAIAHEDRVAPGPEKPMAKV